MIKGTYVIETEVEIYRKCYMGIPYIIMQKINIGISKLKEEAKGALTDDSEFEIIVPRNLYDTTFYICDDCGNTTISMIHDTFKNVNILLRTEEEESKEETISFRAFVR